MRKSDWGVGWHRGGWDTCLLVLLPWNPRAHPHFLSFGDPQPDLPPPGREASPSAQGEDQMITSKILELPYQIWEPLATGGY